MAAPGDEGGGRDLAEAGVGLGGDGGFTAGCCSMAFTTSSRMILKPPRTIAFIATPPAAGPSKEGLERANLVAASNVAAVPDDGPSASAA